MGRQSGEDPGCQVWGTEYSGDSSKAMLEYLVSDTLDNRKRLRRENLKCLEHCILVEVDTLEAQAGSQYLGRLTFIAHLLAANSRRGDIQFLIFPLKLL